MVGLDIEDVDDPEAPGATDAPKKVAPKAKVAPKKKATAATVKQETPVASTSKAKPKKSKQTKVKLTDNQEAFYKALLEDGTVSHMQSRSSADARSGACRRSSATRSVSTTPRSSARRSTPCSAS